jgi:hypothetical protein
VLLIEKQQHVDGSLGGGVAARLLARLGERGHAAAAVSRAEAK